MEFQCNTASGGGTGKKAGREGPEGGQSRISPHRADDEGDSRKNGIAKIGRSDQRQSAGNYRKNHVPNSLMCGVRVASPQNHCDNRKRKRHGHKVPRQRIDRNTGDLIEPKVRCDALDYLRDSAIVMCVLKHWRARRPAPCVEME
jgi:hypothetical protein